MNANDFDFLTGLPTMTSFFELAISKKEEIVKNGSQAVILFITLHGMRNYNQKFGFAGGNEFLKSFASILAKHFENENCCRLGGVHFSVIADEVCIEEKAQKFLEDFRIVFSGKEIFTHIGVYPYKTEDVSINMACDRAKLACDNIKDSRTSGINFYDLSIKHAEENHHYIIETLNKAISERWITVYYQPIVRAVNSKVCDEEALARWVDPVKGFLSPADFIPILEAEKLIYKLDLYIVERVIEKMKHLESLGITAVSHSVNLSRSDFESCDIVEEIRSRVDIAGISRSKLNIEITESVVGNDFEFMKKQILRFKELGFSVWMDDFGAGYSSLNVLKEIPFDLIKFDMSFMRQFDEKNNGKIILTELMKMAFAIGVDTVCEGVETEEQLQFLREIGCSKIQGYYYSKPIPVEQILERIQTGQNIGFENPKETKYFETIGRVNLQDLAVISYGNEKDFNNVFNMIPMAIVELKETTIRYVRTNQSYRNFFLRYFGITVSGHEIPFSLVAKSAGAVFLEAVRTVAKDGMRTFIDEDLPDGSTANYFIRRLAENPVKNTIAVALGVLSIRKSSQGTTFASIAKALSADYFKLFYVNLKTEEYIEYSAQSGEQSLSSERHGENFFEQAKKETIQGIYEEDKNMFASLFTKENILKELDNQGTFALAYRMNEDSKVFYVNMKIMRMSKKSDHIVIGINNIDSQMKQKALLEKAQKDQVIFSRLMSLSGDFIGMYIVDPETEEYTEYRATSDFEKLGLAKQGENFFERTHKNAEKTIFPEDLQKFKGEFTKENIMKEIAQKGVFTVHYRLLIDGEPKPASTRIALVKENGENKLIVGIRV